MINILRINIYWSTIPKAQQSGLHNDEWQLASHPTICALFPFALVSNINSFPNTVTNKISVFSTIMHCTYLNSRRVLYLERGSLAVNITCTECGLTGLLKLCCFTNCKYLVGNFSYVYITVVKLHCLRVRNLFKLRNIGVRIPWIFFEQLAVKSKWSMLYTETWSFFRLSRVIICMWGIKCCNVQCIHFG